MAHAREPQRRLIPILGFVGGVGSGKSALAASLGDHYCISLLDADRAGHAALAQPETLAAVCKAFGPEILDEAGVVNRAQLARIVFGDSPAHAERRRTLEGIVHPVIRATLLRQIDEARAAGNCDFIILDAAIMLESGWSALCDLIIFVDAPLPQRQARVLATRGWSADEHARREASQWPLDRKRAAAGVVIDNSGSLEQSRTELLAVLRAKFPEVSRHSTALPTASQSFAHV